MKIEKIRVLEIDRSLPYGYPSRTVEIKTNKGSIISPARCATGYEFNRKQEIPTAAPIDNSLTVYSKKLSSNEIKNLLTTNPQFGKLLNSAEKNDKLTEYSNLHISSLQVASSATTGPSPIEILSTGDNLTKFMRLTLKLHEELNHDLISIPALSLPLSILKKILANANKTIEGMNRQPFYTLDMRYPQFAEVLKYVIDELQVNCVGLVYRKYREVPQHYEELSKYVDKNVAFITTDVERIDAGDAIGSTMHYLPFFGNDFYAVAPPPGFPTSKDQEKKPKRIFVNSMSDLFHEYATMPFVNMVFHTMLKADWHTYQILTKRPANMAMFVSYFLRENNLEKLPKHIWIGTSCEMQDYTTRIDILRGIPAQVRFVSFEPLLGPIVTNLQDIHWAIVGGESGEGHRPIQESWVTNLLANCRHFGTAFFFKQWGGITPKAGGRLLNGITYDEYPQ